MTIEELKEYIKDKISDINRQYPNTISNEQIERFIESNVSDNMTQTEIDSKKIEIDAIYDDYIARIQQRLEYLKEMKNKFNDNEYQTKNIEELDVSTLDYSQIENLFFQFKIIFRQFLQVLFQFLFVLISHFK
jgi:translation initiation factor 2B subunit (eIF-2B alpha/beta/delta family)